ncbi:MAG: S9 family peptidase [Firmicutes bacterium]|nr:S9 family peptidase [Bacillota bacterium]
MKKFFNALLITLMLFAVQPFTLMAQESKETKLIPREVLFGNPVKAGPQLSPDGKMLAYLAPYNKVLNVWVKTCGGNDDKPVTKDEKRSVYRYFWAYDNKHILYLQDSGGNENWCLYGIDINTGKTRNYTPFENTTAQIIATNKKFPDEILIGLNKNNPKIHDVYRLNLITGEMKEEVKNPGNVSSWLADSNMQIKAYTIPTADAGSELYFRDNVNSPWRKLVAWNPLDDSVSGPLFMSKDCRYFYLKDSRNSNTAKLVRLDTKTGKTITEASDPIYDISGVMTNPDTLKIEEILFQKEKIEHLIMDKSIIPDINAIKKLDSGDYFIAGRDQADKIWLVGFRRDNGPVTYYQYVRKTKKAVKLFDTKPELRDYPLVPMEPISFKSRDGLTIYGYITFPPNTERKNLPMVLNVHGGPWGRDVWGYNPEAQWIANRGYICLQVNFRGSTGYGKKFTDAGNREWAGKMHNDLLDAVNWAVEKGYADPKKVAIFGHSYGGYAALVGATFTPDVFCCAVSSCGPVNLVTLLKTIPPYWTSMLADFHRRVGNPDTEADYLYSISPISKVDQIKIPMLISQGANDPRVKKAEAEQIIEAMKKKGIRYEYLLFPDEGHGYARPENRLRFYSAVEKFFAQYLGGRCEN